MTRCCDLRRRLAACLCLLAFALPAHALDPQRAIRQLTHVWYQNQLPQGTVLSIAQKPDGTLWLATYGGLVRYSGAEFENIDQRIAPALRSSAITAVGVDREGTLFVGTLNGGLYRWAASELVPVDLPAAVESVFGIVQDGGGALWLTTNAGVLRMIGGEAQLLGPEQGFPPRGFYRAIVADREGGVWIAADGLGVVHWREDAMRVFDEADGLPTAAVYSLALAADGTVWAGTQAGPVRFQDGRFQREPRAAALDDRRIYSLHGDRDGNLWFAPLGLGLCRLTATRFDCDNSLDGMGGETVRSMFEDREGNLWVGTTSSGIHRFSNSKLVTATGEMVSNAVRAVYQDGSGTIWVGTDGAGLARYEEQRLVPADTINAGLPSQLVRAILDDGEGRLWVGGTEGVSRIAPDGDIRHFGLDGGLPGTIVFAFARARDGGVWVGSLQGVARIHGDAVTVIEATVGDDTRALHEAPDGRLWIGLRSGLRCLKDGVLDRCGTSGLPGMSVFAFHAARDGSLWIGTSIGLIRVRESETTTYAQRAGFYGDAVFAILDDGAGHFWVSSNRGIARIAQADLAALDRGTVERIEPQWFGQHDGMLASQANGASQTPAWRTRDGRLWFGTVQGVVIVDPAHLLLNPLPPPVVIEGLVVNGREIDPVGGALLGPEVERMELRYAATSYVAPAAVRYRYRLLGYDRDWNEAGGTRVAHYTRLPPGHYSFQAVASNNDGVWNEQGASLSFDVLPAWHQTTTFRTGIVLAVIGLLLGLYRLRLWHLRARERELLREVAQRTDQLRQANERLQRLASLDGLTRIANRSAFDQRLAAAWLQQAGTRRPLAVLLADIDSFKAYNDTYGHLAGDAALTAVAETLAQNLPGEADLAARYGGEEFAVLLPECDATEALRIARRLRESVRALGIEHRASGVLPVVSISVGVAATVPQPGDEPDTLLKRADDALYQAKAEGRDRVVLARE